MIAIFVLLGLGLLGGGAAAIYDGLPYLVLERGFTQVIIGAMAATAGVILLALARVLVEIRRVRTTLANATMALSVASLAPVQQVEQAPAQAPLPGPAAAALGGAAAAGAAIAAASAFEAATPQDEAARETGGETAAEPEDAGREPAGEPAPEADVQEAASASHGVDVDSLPSFDPFRPVDPQGEPGLAMISPEEELVLGPDVAAFARAGAVAGSDAQIPDTGHDDVAGETQPEPEPEPEAEPEAESETEAGPSEPEAPAVTPATSDDRAGGDEFSALRESLAGRLRGLDLGERRVEPSFAPVPEPEPDARDADEAPVDSSAARREPWFDEPAAPEPTPAAPVDDLPPWPPQTREAAPVADRSDEAAGREDEPEAEGAAVAPAETAVEQPAEMPETGDADTGPKPPAAEPAASEEGVVGAYQVGNAHFTIYADGSIQARTPDGDYSFASMDELKVYLASEKNRLGI